MTIQDTIRAASGIAGASEGARAELTLRPARKIRRLVRDFVRGMMKALKFVDTNKDETAEIAKKQFPTMSLDDLKATLGRSFGDNLWGKDGMVSHASWDTAKAVVMGAGLLKTDVGYDEIIDMSFVESVRAKL
ncbi:MAG: hypothetical protein WBE48_04045 [Xanthobacteraceae bacterium]